jgi:hypothetical protein
MSGQVDLNVESNDLVLKVPTLTLAEIALGPVHLSRKGSRVMQHYLTALLTQTTDEILGRTFGKEARAEIYNYLEKRHRLRKNEILAKPDVFSKGISTLFGSLSNLFELNILKVVCDRLKLDLPPKANHSFADYVATLENMYGLRVASHS